MAATDRKGESPPPPSGNEGLPHPHTDPRSLAQTGVLPEPQHTPTPWMYRQNSWGETSADWPFLIEMQGSPGKMNWGLLIAECWGNLCKGESPEANAAHIVRCVNSFDDLLAACKAAAQQLRERLIVASPWGMTLVDKIEAAVDAAEGRVAK